MAPEGAVAVPDHGFDLRAGRGVQDLGRDLADSAALGLEHPPGLAARRHEKPPQDGLGVRDPVGAFHEAQPGRLDGVAGTVQTEPLPAGGVPEDGGGEVNEGAEPGLVAVPIPLECRRRPVGQAVRRRWGVHHVPSLRCVVSSAATALVASMAFHGAAVSDRSRGPSRRRAAASPTT